MSEQLPQQPPMKHPEAGAEDPYAHLFGVTPEERVEDERRAAITPAVGTLAMRGVVDYTELLLGGDTREHIEPKQLTQRQQRLFAPHVSSAGDKTVQGGQESYMSLLLGTDEENRSVEAARGKREAGRWTVTERSEAAASAKLAGAVGADFQARDIIDTYRAAHENMNFAALPEAVRTDAGLRTQLAAYYLAKLDARADTMPDRVRYNDQLKRPTVAGYEEFRDMTSREYTVALALAKLDGTFKPDLESTDPIEREGASIIRGQHRAAADMLLERM